MCSSIDSIHCQIKEPRMQPSSKWCSHKFRKAALSHALGISIYRNQLMWVNGSFPTGVPDLGIYWAEGGLKGQIPSKGRKVIADEGYLGEVQISTCNPFDTPATKKTLKKWANACHETFNGWLKSFKILDKHFCQEGPHRIVPVSDMSISNCQNPHKYNGMNHFTTINRILL
jgi:hypothetical protein